MSAPTPHRRAPRRAALAVQRLSATLAPASTLARAQSAWPEVAGPGIAAAAAPVAERDGMLTLSCRAAVWAAELDLMGPELVASLNRALGEPLLRGVRCRVG